MNHQFMIDIALEAGAQKAAIIPASSVVLSSSFREICQSNACGMYNRCWMCPPDVGDIEELMAEVKQYEHGMLYQTISTLEDSFDIEGMQSAGIKHAWISQRIESFMTFLNGNHLHLTCGGCHLCETCAKVDGIACIKPDLALASMESYGIDVYNTCKSTDLKYINGQNTVTFFGIVLF